MKLATANQTEVFIPPCLERVIASHCGAVLLGKKPAALFTAKLTEAEAAEVAAYLAESGLATLVMRHAQGRALVLAYVPELLEKALAHLVARRSLAFLGYPVGRGVGRMLAFLQGRIRESASFPHEIGFFLGYPPADVVGFMLFGGRHFKHSCMWKVYGNVEKAKALCEEYSACRQLCSLHVAMGGSLRSIRNVIDQAGETA